MTEEELEKYVDELRKEERKKEELQIKAEEKAKRHQAYAVLFLLLSSLISFPISLSRSS